MIRLPLLSLCLAAAAAAPLPAQKRADRDIARAVELIERSVEQALRDVDRVVENALARAEHRQGQSGRSHDDDARFQSGGERIDTTFAFSRNGVVDVTSFSGDIVVTGWNRGEARVRATTERGRMRWRFTSSRLSIETETFRGRSGEASYEISVPEGVRVIMRSTSGDLTARGTRGSVDANTNGGDIEVVDAADVDLHSLSGDITASRIRGAAQAVSVNGTVELQDAEARSIRVESTNGDIVVTGARSKDVEASTVNGDISYRGSIEAGGQYEFHSHGGDIALDIPASVSARFSVETFSGELDAGGFPVTLQPDANRQRRSSRRLEFTLGGGDARVIAETFSGNVELRRESRR